jgi:hypothetical protein
MYVCVADPKFPVGVDNDTPSARPAGATNSSSKNAQQTENRIRVEASNRSMRHSSDWIIEREHQGTRAHASLLYTIRCTSLLETQNLRVISLYGSREFPYYPSDERGGVISFLAGEKMNPHSTT